MSDTEFWDDAYQEYIKLIIKEQEAFIEASEKRVDANHTTAVQCDHAWKEYIGLCKQYKYCEKCDEKHES